MEELLKLRDDALADGNAELVAELDAQIKALEDGAEEEESKSKLDWKAAAAHLKMAVADKSIDRYHKRDSIALCRAVYNAKERTLELYNAIMDL